MKVKLNNRLMIEEVEMKNCKQIKSTIITVVLLITLSITLSGCTATKLSGTFVSELDNTEYLEFSGESNISYYSEDGRLDGSYRIKDESLIAIFGPDAESMLVLQVKNNKTLYSGLTAFVKKGFWEKHWLKIVIGFFVLGIVSTIYEKITGRKLEEDIDKLTEDTHS